MLTSINPATEELIARYEFDLPSDVAGKLEQAVDAHRSRWLYASHAERSTKLRSLAGVLRGQRDYLAETMTLEMGKPMTQALAEVDKCAQCCDYVADHAAEALAARTVKTEAAHSEVRYEPLGIVLGIMPWNFPLWQVIRAAVPALAAGNGFILRHADNVCGCALAIQHVMELAGLRGIFSTVIVDHDAAGELVDHPAVQGVTLTGSTRAGRIVASRAGKALKKCVMELGGSDPFIVIPPDAGRDAFMAHVAKQAADARCVNSGQSCIAAKRFIVVDHTDAFANALSAAMQRLKMGDPTDASTDVGPLAREDLRDALHEQVRHRIEAGARLVCGGEILGGNGWFYPPTVLRVPDETNFDDETFGPVADVYAARDIDHAIELANATPYGLGASVWAGPTAGKLDLRRIIGELKAGNVFINERVKSDPRLPFGGIGESGFGRELGEEGIREMTNVKAVWISG